MVMDLLGKSLEDLVSAQPQQRFSLKTTIMLADQMICRLEFLHSRDYIHRDIKPDNFLMGRGKKKNMVYIIDLGLAKRYRDSSTHQHIPYREDKGLTGTVRYASINSHHGIEQSRRDDLESVGYILIYFLTGSLPWQGLKIDNRANKFRAICDLKMSIPVETLCKDCPKEFELYMRYVKDLHFDAKPDYFYLRRLFRSLFLKQGYTLDFIYDWTANENQQSSSSSSAPRQPPTTDRQNQEKQAPVGAAAATPAAAGALPGQGMSIPQSTQMAPSGGVATHGQGASPMMITGAGMASSSNPSGQMQNFHGSTPAGTTGAGGAGGMMAPGSEMPAGSTRAVAQGGMAMGQSAPLSQQQLDAYQQMQLMQLQMQQMQIQQGAGASSTRSGSQMGSGMASRPNAVGVPGSTGTGGMRPGVGGYSPSSGMGGKSTMPPQMTQQQFMQYQQMMALQQQQQQQQQHHMRGAAGASGVSSGARTSGTGMTSGGASGAYYNQSGMNARSGSGQPMYQTRSGATSGTTRMGGVQGSQRR